MNILYGIAATGNGHISRSRVIVDALRKKGHSIDVLLSGRDKKDLFDIDDLKPFEVKKGFTFVTKKGKISYIKTVLKSLLSFLLSADPIATDNPCPSDPEATLIPGRPL